LSVSGERVELNKTPTEGKITWATTKEGSINSCKRKNWLKRSLRNL